MDAGKETILVVEDDPMVRNYVIAQLRGFGYTTIAKMLPRRSLLFITARVSICYLPISLCLADPYADAGEGARATRP